VSEIAWFPPGVSLDDQPFNLHLMPADKPLQEVNVQAMRGVTGLELPVWTHQTAPSSGDGGQAFVGATLQPKEISIPILMRDDDQVKLAHFRRSLQSSMIPTKGPGKLRVSSMLRTDAGSVRLIDVIYLGGMEGNGAAYGERWRSYTLRFIAYDPLWRAESPQVASWITEPGKLFFPMGLPFTMESAASVLSEPFELQGTAYTWPVWTITGQFRSARATNLTTGESWFIEDSNNWAGGAQVEIQTKPESEGVHIVAGEQRVTRWRNLSAQSVLWAVSPGDVMDLTLFGSTAATTATMEVYPRFWAWV
jgi:hypothetical protein